MLMTDVTFMIVIGVWILFFTTACIVWRGIWIFGILSGLGWFLAGFYWISQAERIALMYQREMGMVFVAIGIAMMLSPMWIKSKQADIEKNPPQVNIWGDKKSQEELEEDAERKRHRDRIKSMKGRAD